MIGLVPILTSISRRSTSEISKGNVLGYYRNLGSLRYGNEYCVPGRAMSCTLGCFLRINLRCGGKQRIISPDVPPILASNGSLATAVHWFVSFTLHEPITCNYNCVIEKGFSWRGKKGFSILTSISRCSTSHISGNRGYVSNRVHFCALENLLMLIGTRCSYSI